MLENTFISAENHWALLAVLVAVGVFGLWAETTKWGSRLSAFVITVIGTFILSNLSIIPTTAPTYDIVWTYLVPLAIPLLLFNANIKKIIKEAGPTLIAFIFGSIGTVLGTVVAFNIVPLGEEGWKIAGVFCATYIGGSINYVAVSEALQIKNADLLVAGVAADNLIMTLYFLVLFALPSIKFLKRNYKTDHAKNIEDTDEEEIVGQNKMELLDIGKALSISFIICAIGFALSEYSGIAGSGILIITAIVVLLATFAHKFMSTIHGADKIGILLIQIFFAAIGASANIGVVLKVGPVLFVFAALILLVHLLFILLAGKIFKLDLAEIVIASNANMGGPTTAAAMAVARRWKNLVLPAILCGTLGYAIATFIGVAVGYWLK